MTLGFWNRLLAIGHHFYSAEDSITTVLYFFFSCLFVCLFVCLLACLFLNCWLLAHQLWETLLHQQMPLAPSVVAPWLPPCQARQSHAKVCIVGKEERMEKSPEQLNRMAVNRRPFCFLLPAEGSTRRAVLLAGVWPCLARADTHLALQNPTEVIRSRWLCLEQSKQILYFWELSLRWSEYWSCGYWHTSSTNREKSVRTILIKDSNGSQRHVDDFFHVLMPLATSGIKRGEYQ